MLAEVRGFISEESSMRTSRIAVVAVCAILGLNAVPAGASLVGHPFGDEAGSCTPCVYAQSRVWDLFDLSEPATISSIGARLDIDPVTYDGGVEFSIWSADLGTQWFSHLFSLSDLSLTHVVSTESDFFYDATADIGQLSLLAGNYALSIYGVFTDGGNGENDILGWVQGSPAAPGSSIQQPDGGGSGLNFSFRIEGEPVRVAEPGTIYLLAAGLLGMTLLQRRRTALTIRS
jgi:hypothetical protein